MNDAHSASSTGGSFTPSDGVATSREITHHLSTLPFEKQSLDRIKRDRSQKGRARIDLGRAKKILLLSTNLDRKGRSFGNVLLRALVLRSQF